jgi:hypothetical protein
MWVHAWCIGVRPGSEVSNYYHEETDYFFPVDDVVQDFSVREIAAMAASIILDLEARLAVAVAGPALGSCWAPCA